MSGPENDDYDEDERFPRRRRRETPFDEFFNNFMNQFGNQFGNFNFENIFDQMDFILEDIFRRFGFKNMQDFKSQSPGFVWGFRMTQGPDGRPRVERFGNTPMREVDGERKFSDEREPLIDIIDDVEFLRVIAEIPGVTKQDIDLSSTDNSLLIQAESKDGGRRYYKELTLPCVIVPESASAKFKNGVLEVELKKQSCVDKEGLKVKVD